MLLILNVVTECFHAFVCAVVSDKVALVIGNQKYENKKLQGLVYSEKDAYDMAHVLSELEFKARVIVVDAITQCLGKLN